MSLSDRPNDQNNRIRNNGIQDAYERVLRAALADFFLKHTDSESADIVWQQHIKKKMSEPIQPQLQFGLTAEAVALAKKRAIALERTGFRPAGRKRDFPSWPLTPPIDWAANPFNDNNWCGQLNSWRYLYPLIVLDHAEETRRHWSTILATLADWMDFHVINNRPNRYGWTDRLTGIRTLILIHLAQRAAHSDRATEGDIEVLLILLAEHVRRLADEDFLVATNHGIAQVHALKLCTKEIPSLCADKKLRRVTIRACRRLLAKQFTEEGIHREHSPGYHIFALKEFSRLESLFDDTPAVTSILTKARAAKDAMFHANGTFVRIGDTKSDIGSITDPDAISARFAPSAPAVTVFHYPASGYVMLKSADATPIQNRCSLFFNAAFHSATHRHHDDLCFEWHDRGRAILIDTGKFSYDSNPMQRYSISTRAHNTLEIDETNYSKQKEHAFGSALTNVAQSGPDIEIAAAVRYSHLQDRELQHPIERTRTIAYRPNERLTVTDQASSEDEHDYIQWFHLAPDLTLDGDTIRAPSHKIARIEIACSAPHDVVSARGQTNPHLGWTSIGYNEAVPTFSFGVRSRFARGVMSVTFSIET